MKPLSRHALRAAVVASGLSMLATGCGGSGASSDPETTSTEAQTSGSDNATGTTTVTSVEGTSTDTSNASCDTATQPTTERCCAEAGGGWDDERRLCYLAVPGPFVPPAMIG